LGFTVRGRATAFDGKQVRTLMGVTRSVSRATPRPDPLESKLYTYAHCLLNVDAMSFAEREQLPRRVTSAWGGAHAVGTIVRFIRVQRANNLSDHVIVKVAVYLPPPPPLPAVDPASQLFVVDRSLSKGCYFHPRSLGPTVALGKGAPGLPANTCPKYWSVLRVDNP